MSDFHVAKPDRPDNRWPHRLAWLLVSATFPLLLVGAAVTGYGAGMSVPDWPTTRGSWFYPLHLWIQVWDLFLEHGHRMLAQLVGVITLALAVLLWKLDSRRAVRWMALAAVLGVILQGTLGGLRVIARESLLARVHGCTAPLFFTLCAALVSVTSPRWRTAQRDLDHPAAGKLHGLLWALTAALYAEIVLGTQLRVPSPVVGGNWFALVVWAKVVLAALIAAGLAWLWIKAVLVRRVRLLIVLFLTQIVLACAAWVTHYGWPAWFTGCFGAVNYTVVETGRLQVVLTTLHVGVGSLCLAASSTILLWSYRPLRDSRR